MRIATIGRGNVGGGLARLWRAAGHDVEEFGREGGDASNADVALLAVPSSAIRDALAAVKLADGVPVIDATNAFHGREEGFDSLAAQVKNATGGPVAKSFNANFATLFDMLGGLETRPGNLFAADNEARAVTEELIADAGYEPVSGRARVGPRPRGLPRPDDGHPAGRDGPVLLPVRSAGVVPDIPLGLAAWSSSSRPRPRRPSASARRSRAKLVPGDVVSVSGELGTGKTTFVRGAARALGIEGPVTSPSYTIGHRYPGDSRRLPPRSLPLRRHVRRRVGRPRAVLRGRGRVRRVARGGRRIPPSGAGPCPVAAPGGGA